MKATVVHWFRSDSPLRWRLAASRIEGAFGEAILDGFTWRVISYQRKLIGEAFSNAFLASERILLLAEQAGCYLEVRAEFEQEAMSQQDKRATAIHALDERANSNSTPRRSRLITRNAAQGIVSA